MRINDVRVNKLIRKLLGPMLLAVIFFVTSDCHAQRQRGMSSVFARMQNRARQYDARHFQARIHDGENAQINQHRLGPRFIDTQNSRYRNSTEMYPKYIGGFHASQIHNIGVPPGDIGFRGNGIYWTPW